jgi:cation:H+ antiporter
LIRHAFLVTGGFLSKGVVAAWSFAGVIGSAFLLAWGAEAAQLYVSQGLALAVLAWLQTLPEFAVEAVIAWQQDVPLMTANFTGSLRLFVGFGFPLIYFTHWAFNRPRKGEGLAPVIRLGRNDAVAVLFLLPALPWQLWVWWKGTLTLVDTAALWVMYAAYLWTVNRIPPEEHEEVGDLPHVSRWVIGLPRPGRIAGIIGLFVAGGAGIYFCAEPFLHSLKAMSLSLGVSTFVFVQWVAPFVSEFPEKVTAFYWAKSRRKAPMGLVNLISSSINQWTLLIGMLPVIYSWSRGELSVVAFDDHQRAEILLTVVQSLLSFFLLANLRFHWYEAATLFVLWLVQFVLPETREEILFAYLAWIAVDVLRLVLGRQRLPALREFGVLWRQHVAPGAGRAAAR